MSAISSGPRLMRLPEAAAVSGLSERQLRRAVHDGRLVGCKPSGPTGPLFIDRNDLTAWIDACRTSVAVTA